MKASIPAMTEEDRIFNRVRYAVDALDLTDGDFCSRDKLAALFHQVWLQEAGMRVGYYEGPQKDIMWSLIRPWNELPGPSKKWSYRWADRALEILKEPGCVG